MSAAILSQQGTLPTPLSAPWMAFVWSSLPGAALAVAAATGLIPETIALGVFAVSFVGLNLMHMGATWARVYVRPGWRGYPIERLAIPLLLVAFALSFEAVGGGALLLAAQYFLSFHHALMQNYGLLRSSQRRTGRSVDTRLDMSACLLLPGAALLYRAGAVCDTYSGATVPSVPAGLVAVLAAAGSLALGAFVWREWRCHRDGHEVDPIGIGILCGTNLLWSALLIADPHPAMPLYALASGHYAQYLYFVWHAERRDPVVATPGGSLRTRAQTFLRSSQVRYLFGLLVLGGGVALLLTFASTGLRAAAIASGWRMEGALELAPWAAAMIGINLEHYWLDHRIWRNHRQPVAQTA